jgi:predicted MFS family arabinose efflux permease
VVSWGAAASSADTASGNGRSHVRPPWRLAVAYLLFGAGYITYITFLSAYLADQHARTGQVALTWTLLGLAAVAGPAVWRRPAPAALLVTLAAAAALPLLWSAPIVVVASALAYGATFMGVPTAVTALVRDATPPVDWTATLSAFTAVFAASQLAGPWAAGALADRTGPGATLAWTAALCALAALFVLRRPAITHRPGTAESSSTAGEPAVPGWTGIPYGAFR